MALHDDLLEQARHLVRREPRRPKQASLRRAVSSAYYALFHLLVHEATLKLGPTQPAGLRNRIRRAFGHAEMKDVSKQFASGSGGVGAGTQELIVAPVEPELTDVAKAFVVLQEERHRADYDVATPMTRVGVVENINMTQKAFHDWHAIRNSDNAKVFLAALLLQNRWNR